MGKGVRVSLNMRRDVVGGGQPRKSSPSYASHIAYEMISAQVLKLLFQNRNHLLEGGESADTLRPVLSSSLYASVMCTGPPFKTLLAHPWRPGSLRGHTPLVDREARWVQRGQLVCSLDPATGSVHCCEVPCRHGLSISKHQEGVVQRRASRVCVSPEV